MTESSRADRIAFIPFDLDTIMPDLCRWLADPDVRPWYDEGDPTPESLAKGFAPEAGLRRLTIAVDDLPVGYIQIYRVGNEPDYQRQIDVDPDAVAIDLFIGAPEFRNKGWGAEVVRTCLARIVFGEMGADLAMIAPAPTNTRAVRSYEKAGFRAMKTVSVVDHDHPQNTGDELIMVLTRDEWTRHS